MAPHSVIRLISRNMAAVGYSNWISRKSIAAAVSSPNYFCVSGARGVSTAVERVSDEKPVPNSGQSSSILSSPWLLLPPDLEKGGENMIYNFYSLAENKVLSLNKKRDGEENSLLNDDAKFKLNDEKSIVNCGGPTSSFPSSPPQKLLPLLMLPPENNTILKFYSLAENKVLNVNKKNKGGEENLMPDDDAVLVGSSHGFIALLNKRNSDLFLSNPLSGHHIKLPPIDTLPIPKNNLTRGVGLNKLIISCSPTDEENCRAMINYSTSDELAFCCPGHSTKWTPISTEANYEDFVYSSRQKLFFCVTGLDHFEAWDLQDPQSPKLIPMNVSVDKEYHPWFARSKEEFQLKIECVSTKFLIVPEKSDELYIVSRFILERIGPDGSHVEANPNVIDSIPYKTMDFTVHKYDSQEKALKYMDNGSLDGLAFFIGVNHGFALRANEFPELKPNSIYFTDSDLYVEYYEDYGGHDLGIFDYENKTFSPCYYPCDVQSIKRIVPPPTWFTPIQPCETLV